MANKGKRRSGRGKQKSSVPAKLRYGKPNPVRGSIGGISSSAIHSQVLGLANPWSKQARGAKVPDSDSSKSIASTISFPYTMTSNPAGKTAFFVRPNLAHNIVVADAIGGQIAITFAGALPVPDFPAFESAFDTYRIVSWGVRVYTTLSPTNQSGSYKIITLPEDPTDGFSWGGSLFEETVSFPLSQQDIHWIGKPIGVDHAKYNAMDITSSWDRMFVAVEGAPASSEAVTVEVVFNLECQINIGSVVATMATESAPHNTHVVAAASKTLAKHGGVHASPSFGQIISMTAKHALVEGAATLLPMIGPLIRGLAGGGGRRNVPMLVD